MESQQAFTSLPRLAGRLTAELIGRSPQGLNACDEYELELRGHKIAAIENLGATQNQFDSIDLSDNEIVKLEGFPPLPRLHTLVLCNNRIARVSKGLEAQLPALRSVVLTNNRLGSLADLDPLVGLPRLTHLSLVGNPVTRLPEYRLYAVHVLKHLKVLDFRKVKQTERDAAAAKFGGADGEKAAAAARSKTFAVGSVGGAEAMDAEGASRRRKGRRRSSSWPSRRPSPTRRRSRRCSDWRRRSARARSPRTSSCDDADARARVETRTRRGYHPRVRPRDAIEAPRVLLHLLLGVSTRMFFPWRLRGAKRIRQASRTVILRFRVRTPAVGEARSAALASHVGGGCAPAWSDGASPPASAFMNAKRTFVSSTFSLAK